MTVTMELVPGWIVATALSLFSVLLLLAAVPIVARGRERRAFLLGLRYSYEHIREAVSRSLPIALLIAVVLAPLSVGDSLLFMVRTNADDNLSGTDLVLRAPSFLPISAWERSGAGEAKGVDGWAPVIVLDASGSRVGSAGSEGVKLIGADERVLDICGIVPAEGGTEERLPSRYGAFINKELSEQLGAVKGDRIRLGIDPIDASEWVLMGAAADATVVLNLTVEAVVKDEGLGRYREDALDKVLPTCIADLSYIGERLDREGEANRVLISTDGPVDEDGIASLLDDAIGMEEMGLSVRPAVHAMGAFVQSDDVLFRSPTLDASGSGGRETLSYFVDSIASDDRSVPYSVVAGLEWDAMTSSMFTDRSGGNPGEALLQGEIALNEWTASALDVAAGDQVVLHHRTVTWTGALRNGSSTFTVKYVVRMTGAGNESGWLPAVPGITDVSSCADWDPEFEVDLSTLEQDDLDYWELYRTTPKAFIGLDDARRLWASALGDTTAIWFPEWNGTEVSKMNASLGLSDVRASIAGVREDALASSRGMLIFPGMFLTFGSAIMLGAALTVHAVSRGIYLRRAGDLGLLKVLGARRRTIIVHQMGEALPSVAFGAMMGAVVGTVLGLCLNAGLSLIWSDAVEGADVPFSVSFGSIVVSLCAGSVMALIVAVSAPLFNSRGARLANLRGEEPGTGSTSKGRNFRTAIGSVLVLTGLAAFIGSSMIGAGTWAAVGLTAAAIVMASGAGLLIHTLLSRVSDSSDTVLYSTSNLSRRPGRTPLTIVVLSIVLSLALSLSFTGAVLEDSAEDRAEGYGGGFDMVLETSLPLWGDLDDRLGGLGPSLEVVPLLSVGKEGGRCSNINAPFPPRLLGVPPHFGTNSSFALSEMDGRYRSEEELWDSLGTTLDGRAPVLVDENTLKWIYFGSLGSRFEVEAEDGSFLELVVVGVLEPSVLTGTFVMSMDALRSAFPTISVCDIFLVREREGGTDHAAELAEAFSDLHPTVERVEAISDRDLGYELSYLYLFRDFMALGLITALAAASVFAHSRVVGFRREFEVLRSIGVSRRKAAVYVITEGSAVFVISALASAISMVAWALSSPGTVLGGDKGAGVLLAPFMVLTIFLTVSLLSISASALIALRDYGRERTRE